MAPTSADYINTNEEKSNAIIFDTTKDELFRLSDNYKTLQRKLKGNWRISSNREDSTITIDALNQARVFVLAGPREKFNENEIDHLKKYLETGGCLLVLLGEGGEKRFDTNINFFLEEYGIMINSDAVVRTNYHKYFHPKECLVSNGVLNRAISEAAGKTGTKASFLEYEQDINNAQALSFVYPHGATLNVARPATPILSTGSVSFPLNRPVCALFTHPGSGGKLAVLGSGSMLADQYIEKEDNNKIKDVIFEFLTTDNISLNKIDMDDPDISDYQMIPDTCYLSNRLRSCLQESDEVPSDFTRLFDTKLYSISTSMLPASINAYAELSVKHEPLKLITPQFETPLPPLQAAVFPPSFRELPNPKLELFDLDEAFSSEKSRLAQITNKCTDEDLDYFIREGADVMGITQHLPLEAHEPKRIVEYMLTHIAEFKKLNQE
ncbi:hypothetical protein TCAL_10174 [Tigriopus californicus]|uniref:Uncharacterized protein n=1 Tax=Tigriopus californicus TaxID=6832 RepID=A0A553PRL4_TIGCA|nr:intraflagellar transport protein 52 homolog [Tigriopus californicus]TRY80327.1 hypothetical protein TCAL_10174 [Tigriopus californicus]|eukprot:TCALIF_10174-PA protein Name:"Similar to IFT52 Intraflagellar transport protein 52 homolog (Homo sapiens)" AED:0.10 eAED:0.10 QI:24/1/0.85/1/1/1/7/64/437